MLICYIQYNLLMHWSKPSFREAITQIILGSTLFQGGGKLHWSQHSNTIIIMLVTTKLPTMTWQEFQQRKELKPWTLFIYVSILALLM